jgi:hypothetical protein
MLLSPKRNKHFFSSRKGHTLALSKTNQKPLKQKTMKKLILAAIVLTVIFSSCMSSRGTECERVRREFSGYR